MERNVGLWDYSDQTYAADLTGYSVEATDGGIGKIDETTKEVGVELHRRRHRAVDLREESDAAGGRDRAR